MLLIPLLLDLLVFFAIQPTTHRDLKTGFEQEAEEVCEGLYEVEERVEEESEFLCTGLPASQQIYIFSAFGFSKRIFLSPSAAASLACGWRMPLLI